MSVVPERKLSVLKTFFNVLAKLCFVATVLLLSGCDKSSPEKNIPTVRYTESITFQSRVLNRPVRYSIYLPADYNKSGKEYPCVYLLHGYGDDETAWVKCGHIDRIINELEKDGTIEPMIYVIPQGFNSYYVNRQNGTFNYMDMFTKELVPMIDSVYRTKRDRTQRAVAGYSMGGYGALILPAMHPDLFSVSVPLSISFRTDEQYLAESQSSFDAQWGPIFGGTGSSGQARLTDYFKTLSPFHFFENNQSGKFSNLHFFIDCGDDEESLSVTNNSLHELMLSKHITHEYRMKNGAHTWDYWLKAMREALPYIQSCFSGNNYPTDPLFVTSETYSGSIEQKSFSGINLNVGLPAGYNASQLKYPVIYFFHQTEQNRLKETKNVMAALDSLQKEKPFILVDINASDFQTQPAALTDLIHYIDTQYRTKTRRENRMAMGQLTGGMLAYNASILGEDLIYSVFLYNATFNSTPDIPVARFIYLDTTDEYPDFGFMQQLYISCRNRDIDHQLRIRNGENTFNSFLNGLNNSTIYIGLMLNKQ